MKFKLRDDRAWRRKFLLFPVEVDSQLVWLESVWVRTIPDRSYRQNPRGLLEYSVSVTQPTSNYLTRPVPNAPPPPRKPKEDLK